MLPPDVFHLEYGDRGVPSEQWATHDLQYAGFLVFQVEHRLAPPNTLPGQATDGRPPFQTDDIKRRILAALADPQCNASPVNLITTGAATSSPPVMLYATTKDPVPYAQADDMYNALLTLGYPAGKFTKYVLPDTTGLHAFNYWHTQNPLVTPPTASAIKLSRSCRLTLNRSDNL